MKKLIFLFLTQFAFTQIAQNQNNVFYAKEFSKEISLYKAKGFVIESVLGDSNSVVKFEIDPLAATSSGELTSLVYNCEKLGKEGLLLGFYGNYWNDAGVVYQGYGFKNLPVEKALELLKKIDEVKTNYENYLSKDTDNNNVYFKYDDMTFLIYKSSSGTTIRVFWNTFDAEWQDVAFKRTKRRFEKKVK
ncbi:MAG: hypothetical protein KBC58_00360 [Flavobacterium sp.]|jgi:hypothetical protein|nr:hypothetical protein [Flavobacterium sp.]